MKEKLVKILEKIWSPITWLEDKLTKYIPYDKWLHLIAGSAICAFLGWNLLSGIILTVLFGIGKEIFDKYIEFDLKILGKVHKKRKTNFDWLDVVATISGILIGGLKWIF